MCPPLLTTDHLSCNHLMLPTDKKSFLTSLVVNNALSIFDLFLELTHTSELSQIVFRGSPSQFYIILERWNFMQPYYRRNEASKTELILMKTLATRIPSKCSDSENRYVSMPKIVDQNKLQFKLQSKEKEVRKKDKGTPFFGQFSFRITTSGEFEVWRHFFLTLIHLLLSSSTSVSFLQSIYSADRGTLSLPSLLGQ